MGLLYLSELRDPADWVDKTAQEILDSVKKAGGWAKVFPGCVPRWLHKIRNYFNVEPKSLRLMDKNAGDHWMKDIRSHGQLNVPIRGKRTLSGHIYFDEESEVWYQMGPGGTIYHWGRKVGSETLDAAYAHAVRGQTGIPIFKLICPDGTGGSKETIVRNSYSAKKIGDTNQTKLVIDKIIVSMDHQGSYNFAETAVRGSDAHTANDVDPHHKDAIYIDPPDRFEPLSDRIFFDYVMMRSGGIPAKKPGTKTPAKRLTWKEQAALDAEK